MPLNAILNKITLRRMPQIENFMKNPIEVQETVFKNLIDASKNTVWGEFYDYKTIKDEKTFRERVPLNDYDSLLPFFIRIMKGEQNVLWGGEVKWFSKSSGTTSTKSKFIPVSRESLEECHYKGGKDMLALYNYNHPESKVFSGSTLALGGSKQENQYNKDIFCGDVSAIIIDNLPFWAEWYRVPKKEIALHPDWEEKLRMMIETVGSADVVSIAGVPSWMLVLLNGLLQKTGKKIEEIWPNLEVYFHGGVSFRPYRDQFANILPDSVNYMETYNASEGFFGLQDRTDLDSMLLLLDYGIYYEFIPFEDLNKDNKRILPLSEVEIGVNYAMVISTNGGLWRYMIGDTICFTEKVPYRFKITGRTKHYINLCGEEVIVDNADKALGIACKATDAEIKEYTGAPLSNEQTHLRCHEWIIEFKKKPDNMEKFAELFDQALQDINSDYEAKRYKDLVLQPPVIHIANENTFYLWLKEKGKLGGQNKVPRMANDRKIFEEILKYLNETKE